MSKKYLANEGNVVIDPTTGEILTTGSAAFNQALSGGYVRKIWFHCPNGQTKKGFDKDDAFVTYEVKKDKFKPSIKVIQRHNISDAALKQAKQIVDEVKQLIELKSKLFNLPHN